MAESLDSEPVPASPTSLGWLWTTAVNYLDQHGHRPIAERVPADPDQLTDIRVDPYIKGARTAVFEDEALLAEAGFEPGTTRVSITQNPEQVSVPFPNDPDEDAYERKQHDVHPAVPAHPSLQEPAKLLVTIGKREDGEGEPLLRERLISVTSERIQDDMQVLEPRVIERLLRASEQPTGASEEVEWEEVADTLGVASTGEVFSEGEVRNLTLLMQLSHEQETQPPEPPI